MSFDRFGYGFTVLFTLSKVKLSFYISLFSKYIQTHRISTLNLTFILCLLAKMAFFDHHQCVGLSFSFLLCRSIDVISLNRWEKMYTSNSRHGQTGFLAM